ncbi:hypothetical protein AVEN_7217-1 [Araneus ventricosus]|uniref:Uncharacterized protein n=1 Tax=Araneus ventricosus TaxID=182803 RepID=A0A4Y2BWJ5_ARAVE|nr:hypothetical protein AVEN_7217-1 [Araneus ventricosus]
MPVVQAEPPELVLMKKLLNNRSQVILGSYNRQVKTGDEKTLNNPNTIFEPLPATKVQVVMKTHVSPVVLGGYQPPRTKPVTEKTHSRITQASCFVGGFYSLRF